MNILILISLLSAGQVEIKLKEKADISGDYISLYDIVEKEGLPGDLNSKFEDVYLGSTGENPVINRNTILFELRYRGFDISRFELTGEKVLITKIADPDRDKSEINHTVTMITAVRAKRSIRKNQVIRNRDIEEVLTENRGKQYIEMNELLGYRANTLIEKGDIITTELIEKPPVVRKGDTIIVSSEIITAPAKVLKDASLNEIVPCVIKGINETVNVKIVSKNTGRLFTGENDDNN